MADAQPETHRYSVSYVTQGKHRFYTLTVPSDVLANTCFVTTREEDPKKGFQRVLDRERAQQIADYIDSGFGSIPTSIVLSAQPEAGLRVIGRGKTIEFQNNKRAFLVLDGQHRVFGFSLAKTSLRVPVVVYNGLSRQDETRLFIDINTKQRPVPNELLLDIKKLAEYESDTERLLRDLFDRFNEQLDSPLVGLMSPATRTSGKISRVTFNAAMKPLLSVLRSNDAETIYEALAAYLNAVVNAARLIKVDLTLTNPTIFRAFMLLFPEAAQRVKDRHGAEYTADHFFDIVEPMTRRLPVNRLKNPGNSQKELHQVLSKALKDEFSL